MTLEPIAIATSGYVDGGEPDDVSIALHGYDAFGGGGPPVTEYRRMFRNVFGVVWRDLGNWDEHI